MKIEPRAMCWDPACRLYLSKPYFTKYVSLWRIVIRNKSCLFPEKYNGTGVVV